jgi:hypothetical protein
MGHKAVGVPVLVKTLRRTYARKLGMLHAKAGDQAQLTADLEHLAAVILMFWPAQDFTEIKPVRPHASHKGGQTGAVWLTAALDLLRTAEEPLTAQEIVTRIMAARGETVNADSRAFVSAECSLIAALGRRRGAYVIRIGRHRPFRWALLRSRCG